MEQLTPRELVPNYAELVLWYQATNKKEKKKEDNKNKANEITPKNSATIILCDPVKSETVTGSAL